MCCYKFKKLFSLLFAGSSGSTKVHTKRSRLPFRELGNFTNGMYHHIIFTIAAVASSSVQVGDTGDLLELLQTRKKHKKKKTVLTGWRRVNYKYNII